MAIPIVHLAHMLGAVTDRAGVTTLMGKINQEGKYPEHVDSPLKNGGNGGVPFYKTLKADAAGVMAMSTDDESVIRYVAFQEKRSTPVRRLGLNPNIPADVVDLIREDNQHLANTRLVRETHAPMSELIDLGTAADRSIRRILTEGTDEEVRIWFSNFREGRSQSVILSLFGRERDWRLWLRLLPFLEDESDRAQALLLLCTSTNERLDWSVTTWGSLLDLLPTPGMEAARCAAQGYQNKYALSGEPIYNQVVEPAPHEWVRFILQRSDSPDLRFFAISAASRAALDDPEIVDELNAEEHFILQMRTRRETYMTEDQAQAIAAKTLDKRDPATATSLLAALREGSTFHGGLSQSTLEDLALLSVTTQRQLELCVRDLIRLMRGFSGQPTVGFEDRAIEQLTKVQRCFRSISFDVAIRDSGDCQIMDRLLPIIPVELYDQRAHPEKLHLLVRRFEKAAPDADESHWETFLSLAEEWKGSYADLLETVVATV